MISLVQVTKNNFRDFQDSLLALERSAFSSPWSVAAFTAEMDVSVSNLWALTYDDELCGYICFWVVLDEIHLLNLAVDSAKRRRGLAEYMIKAMLNKGAADGVRKVWLEVRPGNAPARSLYQKLGFREVGRRRKYYRDTNEDAVVMGLKLPTGKRKARPAPANRLRAPMLG